MSQSMWALRLHERGGPEDLAYEQAPRPYIGIGDAVVRVHAASFTPTELTWPSTWVDHAGHDRRPTIPAHEVSGVVEALGYGTVGVAVGQAVYGLADWYRDGAAAEYVAVEARNLAPKPTSLSHVEAAAVPLAGLTAWQALFDYGGLVAGQRVLIQGAGGGVGVVAVQLARAAGSAVIGTGRAWARELVGELGAGSFVDVERDDGRPWPIRVIGDDAREIHVIRTTMDAKSRKLTGPPSSVCLGLLNRWGHCILS